MSLINRMIQDSLPRIFMRTIPMVDVNASTLFAGSLLHTHQIDAFAVAGEEVSPKNFRAIGGYPILSRLLETDPNYYYDFFRESCLNVALSFSLLSAEEDLLDQLLRAGGCAIIVMLDQFCKSLSSFVMRGFACTLDIREVLMMETSSFHSYPFVSNLIL